MARWTDMPKRCVAILLATLWSANVACADKPGGQWIGEPQPELTKISVQLKWHHQFQFAGFYAAQANGYYRAAGLDVTLVEGGPGHGIASAVTDGHTDFGVGSSALLISRASGHDVVVVAPIFQHSPLIFIAHRIPGLNRMEDLAGRAVMVGGEDSESLAYLRRSGIGDGMATLVPHRGDPLVLRDNRIAAISAYTTTAPYDLIRAHVPFQIFSPRDIGLDFYGDTLFTSGRLARERPDLVRAFRDATLAGWRYALQQTDEIIDIIQRDFAPHIDRRKLEFEAEQTKRLMLADVVDLGYISVNRWRHIADTFASAGLMPYGFSLDGFFFETEPPRPYWLLVPLMIAAGVIGVLSWTSHRFYRMNRTLRDEVTRRRELEDRLTRLASVDDLTGIPNRRAFFETGRAEFARARRDGAALGVIVLDIDRFKSINDSFGHEIGDTVLRQVGQRLRDAVGGLGRVGRLGGEEFAAVLPGADHQAAARCAEHLRNALAALEITVDAERALRITASIGAISVLPDDRCFNAAVARADRAMYEAKNAGRNRVSPGIAA